MKMTIETAKGSRIPRVVITFDTVAEFRALVTEPANYEMGRVLRLSDRDAAPLIVSTAKHPIGCACETCIATAGA